jgi:cell volume regulation protein A
MESTTMETVRELLGLFVIVMVTGMIGGRVSQFLRIPDVAVFLLIGVLVGPVLHWIDLPANSVAAQLLIVFGAALILFDGGRAIGLGMLRKVWLTITMLAVPGVLITAALTSLAAMWLLDIPFIYAFLLAAIIASTDPATLIPVFKQVRINERLKQTVESESAFNDATGSIVVFATLGMLIGEEPFSVGGSVLNFFKMAGGGILVGLIGGWLACLLITKRPSGFLRDYAPVMVITVAVASYLVADLIGVSGFMATFIAGVILGNHEKLKLPVDDESLVEVGHFFDSLTLILRMLIFVLLGTQVDFAGLQEYWWQGLLIVAIFMLVVRPIAVFLCAGVDRLAKWNLRELLFMCWVRETGVIPAALVALIAGLNLKHYTAIQAVTFMAILITIVVQAGTTPMVAKRLGVAEETPNSSE